ncbi:MAG: subtilase family N-terminal domain-containing protein, partial [Bacteroidales bacterium]
MMRNFLAVLFFTLFLNACEKDIIKDSTDSAEKEIVINNESLIQGNIRIKVNEELATQIENARREDGSIINLQAKSVDDVILSSGVSSLIRTFPYAGKFEERTRKAGLHLWYDVVFDTSTPLTKAYNDFSKIPGVKEVELKREIVRYNNNPLDFIDVLDKISITANYSPQVAYPFDDPKLPDQWHYYNKGGTSVFLSGADINVFPVWRSYTTGSDEIIISVVDGGIDYFHEDLVDNIWINMAEYNGSSGVDDDGNGYKDDIYGYNFLTNSPEITPHNHGTHVAGIVAAVNNNGIGVSGVAGGNFKKNIKGARLMSCQIFSSRPEDENLRANTAAAIKYGADNGAVISQNSWGYKETKITPNSIKAAIDYFIEYAGVDEFGNQIGPMKGGIVIFAAGNNDNEEYAPANYEKVLSVASIGPDYAKASYSNFGSWVDISAPGGEYSKGRVLS